MVNLEVPLPPTEEGLYIPAQLVDLGNLFGGKIKAIGGYPIGLALDRVADQTQRSLRLIHSFLAQEHLGIVEDNTAGSHRKGLKTGLEGVLLNAADEMLARCLELVEVVMALVSPVGHCGFSRLENPVDEWPLSLFAAGEKDLSGNTPVEVKADMGLGLFCALAVVGPLHGKDGVDQ